MITDQKNGTERNKSKDIQVDLVNVHARGVLTN